MQIVKDTHQCAQHIHSTLLLAQGMQITCVDALPWAIIPPKVCTISRDQDSQLHTRGVQKAIFCQAIVKQLSRYSIDDVKPENV